MTVEDRLQMDLRNIFEWSQEWHMLFYVDECRSKNIGHNNIMAKYEVNVQYLEEATEERDLGVFLK